MRIPPGQLPRRQQLRPRHYSWCIVGHPDHGIRQQQRAARPVEHRHLRQRADVLKVRCHVKEGTHQPGPCHHGACGGCRTVAQLGCPANLQSAVPVQDFLLQIPHDPFHCCTFSDAPLEYPEVQVVRPGVALALPEGRCRENAEPRQRQVQRHTPLPWAGPHLPAATVSPRGDVCDSRELALQLLLDCLFSAGWIWLHQCASAGLPTHCSGTVQSWRQDG